MSKEPHLRPVSDSVGPDAPLPPKGPSDDSSRRWTPGMIALAIALSVALVLLIWSRSQMGERIEQLQDQVGTLRDAVAERDRALGAHRARLGAVKGRVEELQELIDAPLHTPNPVDP